MIFIISGLLELPELPFSCWHLPWRTPVGKRKPHSPWKTLIAQRSPPKSDQDCPDHQRRPHLVGARHHSTDSNTFPSGVLKKIASSAVQFNGSVSAVVRGESNCFATLAGRTTADAPLSIMPSKKDQKGTTSWTFKKSSR